MSKTRSKPNSLTSKKSKKNRGRPRKSKRRNSVNSGRKN